MATLKATAAEQQLLSREQERLCCRHALACVFPARLPGTASLADSGPRSGKCEIFPLHLENHHLSQRAMKQGAVEQGNVRASGTEVLSLRFWPYLIKVL